MDDKQILSALEDETIDFGDNLHRHFEDDFGRWDWCEVYEEGVRIYNLITGENVETFSPLSDIFAAVAAQAHNGAMSSVAAALGVDARDLSVVASEWAENQDDPPSPVGAEKFVEMCKTTS